MGSAYYIVLERDIDGLDIMMDGKRDFVAKRHQQGVIAGRGQNRQAHAQVVRALRTRPAPRVYSG